MTDVNVSGLELARQFVQLTTSMNSIDIHDEDPIRVPAGHLRSAAAELQRLQAERDALAAKLAEATIDGARAMREHAAQVAWESAHTDECAGDVMQEILNIPLPSAADQARKPLTDDQITEEFERMLGPLKDSRDEGTYLSALAWFRRGAKLARSCDN